MDRLVAFTSAAGAGAFVVERLHVSEALTGVPEYRVELLSCRTDIAASTLLGTTAAISLEREDGASPRWFHGHVASFACAGAVRTPAFAGAAAVRYEAVLRPGLWFLTRRADSRVHRGQHLADLLAMRLADAGAMSLRMDLGPTEWRDFVVQYRETDFHFVSRLAEHVGACWRVEHAADAHRLVVTDRPGAPTDAPPVRLAASSPSMLASFTLEHEVQPGVFAGTDYHYVTPRTSLAASAAQPADHEHAGEEMFDAPLDALTPAWADAYARLRMEALACRRVLARGTARSRELHAGGRVVVEAHPVHAMNGEWLVTRVELSVANNLAQSGPGDGAEVLARFEAVPVDTPWRPTRTTPRPTIAGTQTARVVADFRDDMASTDGGPGAPIGSRLARVRVAFFWDRRAEASCWARVSQPWASRGFGFQNMPRIGDEVLVQFVEGDPDRPVVVGRVHNADLPPPYALPRHAAVTGLRTASLDAQGRSVVGRFNELRFDDTQGGEHVYLQAQRDLDERVGGDRHASVDGHSHRVVAGDALDAVGGARHLRVDGAAEARFGQTLRASVAQDLHLVAGAGRIALAAGDEVHLRAGARLVLDAAQGVTLRCGPSFVEVDAAGVRIDGPLVSLRCGGAADAGQGASTAEPRAADAAIRSDGSRPPPPFAS